MIGDCRSKTTKNEWTQRSLWGTSVSRAFFVLPCWISWFSDCQCPDSAVECVYAELQPYTPARCKRFQWPVQFCKHQMSLQYSLSTIYCHYFWAGYSWATSQEPVGALSFEDCHISFKVPLGKLLNGKRILSFRSVWFELYEDLLICFKMHLIITYSCHPTLLVVS